MSNILMSVGPIPARIDSVKYITNRFKGGLALKTAEMLSKMGHRVTLVTWKYTELDTGLPVIHVNDVYDYYDKMLDYPADAYILAAAVANLGPTDVIEGKFPSHLYKEGDKFNIEFTIMPRVIDAIKKKYPRCTLIGYKLFDGTEQELIDAARHTLLESKANLVFANHPAWAKTRKIAITADGAQIDLDFDQHVGLIHTLLTAKFYTTELTVGNFVKESDTLRQLLEMYPRSTVGVQTFGCFAMRTQGNSFLTTSRGKYEGDKAVVFVDNVNHDKRIISTSGKATLNAPLLHALFQHNPYVNFIIHGHAELEEYTYNALSYEFPGTDGDLSNLVSDTMDFYDPETCVMLKLPRHESFTIQLTNHGYIACFTKWESCKEFLEKYGKLG
jgi:hypothetical protein